ncbi:MAG: DUF2480 family protein [Bacteroidetes bacterium]|nr:MAG: DUF2480 family protein [Bacteroidota bacterium]
MQDTIVNRVAESALVSLSLEDLYSKADVKGFDLKDFLFMGLILKEKEYREALKQFDWTVYAGVEVAVFCSADAIVPMWAYMLAAAYLQPVCKTVVFGTEETVKAQLLLLTIANLPVDDFKDKRVVVKGCGELPIGEAAYLAITAKLLPVAKSIMYGEPCSTVPIFKRAKV